MDWKELQIAVAKLFKSVRCSAEVDKKIEGARSEHCIDVYVQFNMLSFSCIWIIECKNWNSNITKEKVLALKSIVQDVGADKGILVSIKGFQSGAIRSARDTNIILTNFDDLKSYIDDQIRNSGWEDLTRRVQYLSTKLLENKYKTRNYCDIGYVSMIELKIKEALFGSGRMVLIESLYEKDGEEVFIKYTEPKEFLMHANQLLDDIQKRNGIA